MQVIYSEAMLAPAQGASPSAAKPRPVVDAWKALDPKLRIVPPKPVTVDQICAAHERQFVEDVFALRIDNGFGTRSAEVTRSLPYTSGAMLTAARIAHAERTAVAAPVSGFHHATWNVAMAYCTFNGLMVTALALRAEHPKIRVGILDYDYHYGNGTHDIITRLKLSSWITHITAGGTYSEPAQAQRFLANIPNHIEEIAMAHCDVVLYQAGADPHIDDPLGGFLTTPELKERDRRVFTDLHARNIPVAWNLAGGYQQPLSKVIAIHRNTYEVCSEVFDRDGAMQRGV
jgi:acetoin utilization deacetylase AcuC-like enzyme